MSKINKAIHEIHHMDDMAERDQWLNNIRPLAKVVITLFYMILVMSFPKENLSGLLGMVLYLLVLFILGELPVKKAFHRLRYLLLAICLLGVANPIFDRTVVTYAGQIPITGGIISMVTLFLKAGFAVFASFILIETTSIEGVCYALRTLHVPSILVTLIMLIYRYMILMLKETERVTQAYSLRAPNQKGIHYKAWGPLAGQMLLRSIDRAERVYESMVLRGFHGEFYLRENDGRKARSVCYVVVWVVLLLVLRIVPVFELVGSIGK